MNVYEIFTKLTLQNNASSALAAIAKEALALEGGLGRIAKQLETVKGKLAIGGGLSIFGGAAGVAVVAKIAEHGTKLLDQQDKLQRSGIAYADVLKLQADYYEKIGRAIPTSTASEYLKTVNELRTVTGSMGASIALAPRALMADALLSNTLGSDQSGAYYKLLRSAEMKGISTDPAKLAQMTDAAFSYITAFGGKLTPQDFQTFARRGGTAWMNMKPESFGPAAVAMADLGGPAAGTAMMTLQQLQQGTMTLSKQQAATLEKAGLLDMSKTSKTGFGGGRLQLEPGAILGSLQYAGDLAGWVKNVVYPHMMAAAGGDEALFQNMLGKEAPNRNAAKMIEMFGNKGFLDQIAKDLGLAGQVKPIEQAYSDFISRNPKGVQQAFSAQYESMMQAIGAPMMQAALPAMKAVTDMFTTIGNIANAHPDAMKNMGITLAGISVGLIALGSVAVLGAMAAWIPGGIAAVAVVSIGGAVTALAALKWSSVTNALVAFGAAIDKLTHIGFDWLAEKFNALGDAIRGMLDKIKGWFQPTSYEGGGGFGGGITRTAWSGGGGGVLAGGTGGGDMMGAVAGSPALRQYLATGGHGMDPQTTAWCAAYVGAYLNHHGYPSLASNVATSYLNYGSAVTDGVQAGDVVVLPQGHGAGQVGGHVGIATGRVSGGRVEMFAGNTGHGVAREWERLGSAVIRRPPPHHQSVIHNTILLDGEPIHRSVVKRMVRGMTHPTTAPYHDGSRHWTPPDAGLVGV